MSPDIIMSPGFVLLATRLAFQRSFSNECIISFHPGGGAPSTGQQRQGARGQGLSTLQERDLSSSGGKDSERKKEIMKDDKDVFK